ncbi:MAG: hypothetical protein IPL04_00425 [Chitinophagaceae bacterium]|nr:hypothetical protein [Chitinophagaceae bacterium]
MPRKKQTSPKEVTPALLKFREKRKWQINYRRYVLEESPCPFYAPYFGLDIKNLRQWFEYQFTGDLGWDNFGKKWQFDHVIPVTYFDFANEEELKMCWNFTNIRVEKFQLNKDRGNGLDILKAKNYFKELLEKTNYAVCSKLLSKIDEIEVSDFVSTEAQQLFIRDHSEYLEMIKGYSAFEFELLNSGRSIDEVKKEIDFYKNIGKQSK